MSKLTYAIEEVAIDIVLSLDAYEAMALFTAIENELSEIDNESDNYKHLSNILNEMSKLMTSIEETTRVPHE